MKKLGTIHNKTRDSLLIVKSLVRESSRIIGALVYDRDMKRIGRVVDVIGRVDSPYIVVKPDDPEYIKDLEINTLLYYYIIKRKTGKKRIRRKRGKGGRKRGGGS
ncbi:MAG: RNA-binding protein [Desulfurococcales archaeon ex4484_58]|nr:MAG: RNA-binding protein [Desulfurococcales archaeon ex4484_58]